VLVGGLVAEGGDCFKEAVEGKGKGMGVRGSKMEASRFDKGEIETGLFFGLSKGCFMRELIRFEMAPWREPPIKLGMQVKESLSAV
jgi:hypothetical protein